MLRYFCFLAVILGARSALAPFIKACKIGDRQCIIQSAQAALPFVAPGIPELNVPSLDPLRLDLIKGDQGSLKLTFKDTDVKGMKGCSVDNVKQNLSKGKQTLTIRCSVTLTGDYTLDGQLAVLPVQGQGKYTIRIRDIVIKAHTDLETVNGTDGKQHWHIKNWRHTYEVKTSTTFKFENLFGGNKALADPIDQFLNSNWRDVMKEVAPPIVYAIVEGVVKGVEALYKAVPVEELYIP